MICAAGGQTRFATSRLILRKPKLSDAGPLFRAYTCDPDVVRYLTWRAHQAEDETRHFLELCLGEWRNGSGYPYVIEIAHGESGPVGMIHLRRRAHEMIFGYALARPYWGNGYMTEALRTVVDWSLGKTGIWRASALCDIDNVASARVMEKAGMTFEGILRRYLVHPNVSNEPRDCKLYAKVRA